MNAPVPGLRTPIFDMLRRDTAQRATPQDNPDLVDFTAMLRTIWRSRGIIAVATVLGAVAGLAWALWVADPRYRATAHLVMAADPTAQPSLEGMVPGLSVSSVAANTEVEILQSRVLLRQVVETLALDDLAEFNPDLQAPGMTDQIARTLGAAPPDPGADPISATIDALSDRLSIRNIPDSRVFEVTAESLHPGRAAEIANAVAALYLRDQVALKQQDATRATVWLEDRVSELRAELETADSRAKAFAAQMELVSPEHLNGLSAQLKEIRQRIATKAANGAPQGQLRPLRQMEATLSAQLDRQSADMVTLGQLRLEAEASRAIYEHFLARLKEASVQRGVQTADARLLSPAEVPARPATPSATLATALAALLALIAASTRALVREAMAETMRSSEILEATAGYGVIGEIPKIPRLREGGLADHVHRRPGCHAAEALRHLRTTLYHGNAAAPGVLLVTSSAANEGKSSLSRALAHSLSGIGKRVLLIEADIRRRPLRRRRRNAERPGLLSVLDGKASLGKAVFRDDTLGIWVLPGETAQANTADVLSSRQMDSLIKTARQNYDVIIIDTPPVLAVPDTKLIGRSADAVLFAVAWDRTRRGPLRQALKALETMNIPVAGLVMTQIDAQAARRYGLQDEFAGFAAQGYYESA